jgi:hypothetical protein
MCVNACPTLSVQIMSENESKSARPLCEVVAGVLDSAGTTDGALKLSRFNFPLALCRFGDSLLVADYRNNCIRAVDGVLGVEHPLSCSDEDGSAELSATEYEERVVPLIMSAIDQAPKELAQLVAQYARPGGRTRVLWPSPSDRSQRLQLPSTVALDTTDPVTGPQLIIGTLKGALHQLNLQTLKGKPVKLTAPAQGIVRSIVVAPTGVLSVCNGRTVTRLSAAYRSEPRAVPMRKMTTFINAPGPGVQFAGSSAKCFQTALQSPWAMTLRTDATASDTKSTGVASSLTAASNTTATVDPERDAGVLYVGCGDGVHVFDLTCGERKCFAKTDNYSITGLALTDDGARLFAVGGGGVLRFDTSTGAISVCASLCADTLPMGCVLDPATRSLVLCMYSAHVIMRVRGIDV